MRGKIILEEHVCMPEDNAAQMLAMVSRNSKDLEGALLDLHQDRLQEMNDNGVEHAIISQNPPGAQGIKDPQAAEAYARRSNNYVAELVGRAPERFTAFASLSMHDPGQAVVELKRCVTELGMVGVLLNDAQEYISEGQVEEHLYDEPQYDVFWSAVQELEVPVYLHPKGPLPRDFLRLYKTRPWLLGPTWSFARDTGFHALALCTSGVFDRFPGVKLILGHMGMFLSRSILSCGTRY
jgi:2,3-dihydroxybenzoate decarboxylase